MTGLATCRGGNTNPQGVQSHAIKTVNHLWSGVTGLAVCRGGGGGGGGGGGTSGQGPGTHGTINIPKVFYKVLCGWVYPCPVY